MGREDKILSKLHSGRWRAFGKRLEQYRVKAGLTQEQAAEAVGVTVRQWRRYASGVTRVSPEMIRKIAKALEGPEGPVVTAGKLLLLAGHESDDPGVDVEAHLRLIRDYVLEGVMSAALFNFYEFYYDVNSGEKKFMPMDAPLLANNFTAAAVAIDNMPNWLRREFIVYLLATEMGGRKEEFPVPAALWKEARALIRRDLPKAMLLGGRLPLSEYRRMSGSQGVVPGTDGHTGAGSRSHEKVNRSGSDQVVRPDDFVPAAVGHAISIPDTPKKKLTAGVPVEAPPDDLDSLAVDAELLASILVRNEPERLAAIESKLAALLRRRRNKLAFAAIGRRFETLKRQHRRGKLTGFELLARLLELARELAEAEKGVSPHEVQKEDKAALSKLFKEVRGDLRPARVRLIVDEIDRDVRFIRFRGWQQNFEGEHTVIKSLRMILCKYNLNHEHKLFDQVYKYIKEYY